MQKVKKVWLYTQLSFLFLIYITVMLIHSFFDSVADLVGEAEYKVDEWGEYVADKIKNL